MVPTLKAGDLLCTAPPGSIRRGTIVVFHPSSDTSQMFVERVVGVPGDIIEIDGAQTPPRVLIKPEGMGAFQVLIEPYVSGWTTLDNCCASNGEASSAPQPVTVLAGFYFVLGDNRNFASDSRIFGFVPAAYIVAVVKSDQGYAGIYSGSSAPSLSPEP